MKIRRKSIDKTAGSGMFYGQGNYIKWHFIIYTGKTY